MKKIRTKYFDIRFGKGSEWHNGTGYVSYQTFFRISNKGCNRNKYGIWYENIIIYLFSRIAIIIHKKQIN